MIAQNEEDHNSLLNMNLVKVLTDPKIRSLYQIYY